MNAKIEERTKKASIVPDVSLMKKFASVNGTIVSRIMELVDNSIDAKIDGKQLNVEIKIVKSTNGNKIVIKDNASGMDEDRSARFFKLADSAKRDGKKIGRFGLGAKIAILGLGNKTVIKTKEANTEEQIEIKFDINEFDSWEIEYEKKKGKYEEHGTSITIEELTIQIGDVKKMENRLAEAIGKTYKHFIKDGDVIIKINGNVVGTQQPELIEEFYQEFDFEVNGKRVRGWAGAMKTAGKNWKFGFDLINNKRIIKSNDFLTRQAHTSLARLTGEIYLDDFRTDIHKTDFIRDTEEFQTMQKVLIEEHLDELITKVSQLTNRDVFMKYQDKLQDLSRVLNKVIKNNDFFTFLDLNEDIFSFLGKKTTSKATGDKKKKIQLTLETLELEEKEPKEQKEKKERKEKNPNKNKIGFYVEEPVFVSIGQENDSKRWEVSEQEDGIHLKVEINIDHATYQTESEAEAFIKNAIIDSIAEFIVKEEEKHNHEHEDTIERLNNIKDTIVRYSFVG